MHIQFLLPVKCFSGLIFEFCSFPQNEHFLIVFSGASIQFFVAVFMKIFFAVKVCVYNAFMLNRRREINLYFLESMKSILTHISRCKN